MTAGQDVKLGDLTLTPFGGLLASRWTASSFTETGAGIYNSSLGNQRADSVRSQLGAEARLTLGGKPRSDTAMKGDYQIPQRATLGWIQPHVRAAWLHEFYNGSRSMHASFADSGVYSLMTRRAQRNSMLYNAGLDLRFTPQALLYTDFTAQGGGDTKVLSEWRVGLSISY
jgi:outer membrane autotransporter protein